MKKLTLISSLFLLSSCAISADFRSFQEPAGGDRAMVRVVNNRTTAYSQRNCIGLTQQGQTPESGIVLGGGNFGSSSGFTGRSLGMPPGPSKVQYMAEFYVEAGKSITLVMDAPSDYSTCVPNGANSVTCGHGGMEKNLTYACDVSGVEASFIPKKGKNYEATYSDCKIKLYDLDNLQKKMSGTQINRFCTNYSEAP